MLAKKIASYKSPKEGSRGGNKKDKGYKKANSRKVFLKKRL